MAVALLVVAAFVGPYWYDAAPAGAPALGVSFSCRQARYLGDDCATVYNALLDDLGVRHVRLSLYWADCEPEPGRYDFAEADELVSLAVARGADVLLTLGIKAQRYPEVYLPAWLAQVDGLPEGAVLDHLPGVRPAALGFVQEAVRHFTGDSAVIGWQVENEPFIKNFDKIRGWVISPEMITAEVAAVRAADGSARPVVVTHSSWTVYDQGWKRALAAADVIGQNVFTKKAWLRDWWYFFPYEMGPFVPALPQQAALARRQGKQLWITELQAEPEERRSLKELEEPQPNAIGSISPRLLQENVAMARRSGARRIYLWGAEWWYATRGRDARTDLWEEARRLFAAR